VSDTIFGVVPSSYTRTIQVFPALKDSEGTAISPASNIPRQAKNVIVSVRLTAASNTTSCLFTAASDSSRLGSGTTIDATEYGLYKDAGDSNQTLGQFFVPLSSNGITSSFAVRGYDATNAGFSLRVVGWTL
jgi:hypothetical protein